MMGSSSSSSAVGLVGLGGSAAQPSWWNPPRRRRVGPTPVYILSVSPSLRLSSLLQSSFKELSLFYNVPRLKDLWCEKASQFKEINLQFSNDIISPACSSFLFFFNGGETRRGAGDEGTPHLSTPRRNGFNGRQWTNILLGVNILIFVAQLGTQGKLLVWGAKINSLIDKGQVWRLATSSFLHANIGHLLVNCYSLNSIGPTVEALCGPRRFLSVYFASAIASSAASYWFCKGSAVGASGAIFGLVGSLAVFVLRHQGMIRGGREELQHLAQVIFLNMMFGLMYKGIDNWGHLGGLVGGVAVAWLVGPAWKSELSSKGRVLVDRAPIRYLTGRKPEEPRDLN